MIEKVLYATPALCTGCNRCVYVCSAVKEKKFIPSKSRIHINNFPEKGYSVPSICFQCSKPDCLAACPERAIYKNESERVLVDSEKCNGCGDCMDACPYGVIEVKNGGVAIKCDGCNGDPACVKECYPGALVYQAPEKEMRKARGLQMKQRTELGLPHKKRYQLGVNILAAEREDG